MRLRNASNPLLRENFSGLVQDTNELTMTANGAIQKSLILISLTLLAGFYGFTYFTPTIIHFFVVLFFGVGLVIASSLIPKISPITAPIYAILQGLFIGGISASFSEVYYGIVIQALFGTISILIAMLFLYQAKIIKATEKFRAVVISLTFGIFLLYLLSAFFVFVLNINFPFLHDANPIGIGISIFILIVASLNLIIDFDNIEQMTLGNLPKYMEWYGSLCLLITLLWIYVEVLSLLAQLHGDGD